jgi:hypothetical protein
MIQRSWPGNLPLLVEHNIGGGDRLVAEYLAKIRSRGEVRRGDRPVAFSVI